MISTPSFQIFADIRVELEADPALRDSITNQRGPEWTVKDGLIPHGSRVFIPSTSVHLQTILQMAHTAGHEGIQKTIGLHHPS